jgi:hypothetical protein
MSLKEWVTQLRELHAKAKSGKISKDERAAYEAGRDQLARAMISSQQLTLKPGETPRRALRVARALQVDLDLPSGPLRTPTVDLSAGGFAALVPTEGLPTEPVKFKLRMPSGDPIEGRARPVGSTRQTGSSRVSFVLEEIAEEQRARIETVVFETALALFNV